MKIFRLLAFTLISVNLFSNELQWVNEQINAIKPPRNGVSSNIINNTKSPFVFLSDEEKVLTVKKTLKRSPKITKRKSTYRKKTVKRKSNGLQLDAIINNSVLINGKWYKRNSKVGKYRVSVVNRNNVILTYKKNELVLSMANKNKKLKFKRN